MALLADRVESVPCPQCGDSIDVAQEKPFTVVACKSCGRHVRVPVAIGPLLVRGKLGLGATGIIYAAHDRESDRPVAMKIITTSSDTSDEDRQKLIDKTLAEAEALKAINHPNIVRILRIGEHAGQPYILMELLSGGSLQDLIDREGQLDELRALELTIGVADGLRGAASIDLLHLDVKPQNIVLDGAGSPKLLDFGYGQDAEAAARDEIPGTPFYVAPELVRRLSPTIQCDMYSLGATLYQLLTGRFPFEGRDVKETIFARLGVVAPNVRLRRGDLHFLTGSAVACMLYEDPEERYEDYDSLIYDLQRARDAVKAQSKT